MTRTERVHRPGFKAVIVGGGVAGIEGALALRALAPEHVDVELVSAERHFYYRPLAVAEPFGLGSVHRWELADLAHRAGVGFSIGQLTGVDLERGAARFASGAVLEYDALLIALGARAEKAVPGALTFRGPADAEAFRALLDDVRAEGAGRLAFTVPSGPVWPLPVYELALLSASELEEAGADVEVSVHTSEPSPLALFGAKASAEVASLLGEQGIALTTSAYPAEFVDGTLRCVPNKSIEADWVVACPRLAGPEVAGLPRERSGFVPVDEFGRVPDTDAVYAAGDMTTFPIKQGGIAAAQADTAARSIAARAGADVEPIPFQPVLRALLVSGKRPTFMRVEVVGGRGETSTVSQDSLWWPPGKIVGHYLSPFLAELGLAEPQETEDDPLRIELRDEAITTASRTD